eukprot:5091766-Amphidinium_carterae.1
MTDGWMIGHQDAVLMRRCVHHLAHQPFTASALCLATTGTSTLASQGQTQVSLMLAKRAVDAVVDYAQE